MSEDKKNIKISKSKKVGVVKNEAKKDVVKKSSIIKKEEISREPRKEKTLFLGKYIRAIGRRKTSVAQVRMYEEGSGELVVNGLKGLGYFKKEDNINIVLQPLKAVSKVKDFDISITVKGGGVLGQLDAIRHGISRALVKFDPELKMILKTSGYITRDPRKKERKKPGLKKARKAPQWSKR